jgi:hypothetical protein
MSLTSEEDTVEIGIFLLVKEVLPKDSAPPNQLLLTPDPPQQTLDTPTSAHIDPTYHPHETHKSRREM